MIGVQAIPGFWCDYYMCRKDNIVETINYMLSLHAPDFPITACGGFKIEEEGEFIKIIPIVLRNNKVVCPRCAMEMDEVINDIV